MAGGIYLMSAWESWTKVKGLCLFTWLYTGIPLRCSRQDLADSSSLHEHREYCLLPDSSLLTDGQLMNGAAED